MRRTPIGLLWLVFLCMTLAACPARNRRQVGAPKIDVPTNGDAQARARFNASRSQFERDEHVLNAEAFEAIVRDYPDDPIVPHALLYGAMADLRSDQVAAAVAKLDEVKRLSGSEPMLFARASLFRGLALVRLGRLAEALSDLRAGEVALNRDDSAELAWWHGAMAEGAVLEARPMDAILQYDAYWRVGTASERSYAADRVSSLVANQLDDAQVEPLFARLDGRSGPALAFLGRRLMRLEPARAASLADRVAVAEKALGIEGPHIGSSGPGDPGVIGALLPMSGRLNRVGELSMRGLVLASQRHPGARQSGGSSSFSLVARDTSSASSGVSEGLQALVAEEAVAVIGPFDGSAVSQAGTLAASLGVSLISLAPRSAAGGELSIRHSAEERAQTLARHAYGSGVRDFAVFAPRNAYGQAVGRAFVAEVGRLGGQVVVSVDYPADTTSFKEHINKLNKPWKAVFVPDLAKRVELIAPALAAANFNAMPLEQKSKRGRSILLLSTAEGLDQSYLRSSGRYSLGAVFAPGFYSDRTDPAIAAFVGDYEAQFGSEPGSHEAYAFDAVRTVRHAVDQGARTRSAVAQALRHQKVVGVTGTIEFGSDGRRLDAGLLFEVQQPIEGQFELRALR